MSAEINDRNRLCSHDSGVTSFAKVGSSRRPAKNQQSALAIDVRISYPAYPVRLPGADRTGSGSHAQVVQGTRDSLPPRATSKSEGLSVKWGAGLLWQGAWGLNARVSGRLWQPCARKGRRFCRFPCSLGEQKAATTPRRYRARRGSWNGRFEAFPAEEGFGREAGQERPIKRRVSLRWRVQ